MKMFLAALFLRAEKLETAQCASHINEHMYKWMNQNYICLTKVDVKKNEELQKNT